MSLQFEHTDRVLTEDRLFHPDKAMVEQANITAYMKEKGFEDWDSFYKWSIENPDTFWEEQAKNLEWFAPWNEVKQWKPPYVKWFVDAKCNIVYNALDRHMGTPIQDKVAFYWEGESGEKRTLSYRDLYDEVNRLANALKDQGIKKGDTVIIYLPRVPEQIISMLAVARIGAVHSVVFSAFTSRALNQRVEDAQAKAVICSDGYQYAGKDVPKKPDVDEAIQGTTVEKVIVVKRAGNEIEMQAGRDVWYDEIIEKAERYCPCEPVSAEHPLFTLYTSGTTGRPKGVVHVHGGYMVQTYATTKFTFDLKPTDVFYCTADPGWVTGHTYIVYGPMIVGATSVFYDGSPTVPDAGRLWKIAEHYGVTVFYTAPTAIRGLMRHGDEWPNSYDLSKLRLLGSVGEPINPEAWIWYHNTIGKQKCPIVDTWWQTETGAHVITPLPITPLKPGSATYGFPGIHVDVVDSSGAPVPNGKGGYLVIREPWPAMMRTLYNDDERYRTYWETIPGVYLSGDSAYRDEDGYIWIQGRTDDVITKAGHRLGSMEIESALVEHDKVIEAAVIGKPHDVTGESIKAFIIVAKDVENSDELISELKLFVRTNMGPISVPDEIEVVTELPKTRSGKIMRRYLRAKELGLPTGDVSTLESD